jgi:signal transduction histidine kinase
MSAATARPRRRPRVRFTVRLRLTALYSGLLIASSAVLIATTYGLVSHATGNSKITLPNGASMSASGEESDPGAPPVINEESATSNGDDPSPPDQPLPSVETFAQVAKQQHSAQMHEFLVQSLIALGITAVLSVAVGWFAAGRVLRNLRTITTTARDISATNLHQRLAIEGPDDELKELGDTFDELLARLETAFEAQQRFVANASHELRTPLARQRTLIQVALADPDSSVESLRATHERVLASGRHQERLIDALLTLARGETGLDRRVPFDLSVVANRVLLHGQPDAEARGVRVKSMLAPAPTAGNHRLVERLVTNLLDNAIVHNTTEHDGCARIDIETGTRSGRSVLTVTNTGPVIPAEAIDQLFVPFRRLGTDRAAHGQGLGLGLSIVKAIADAHNATVTVTPNTDGGLRIEIEFPESRSDSTSAHHTDPHLVNASAERPPGQVPHERCAAGDHRDVHGAGLGSGW